MASTHQRSASTVDRRSATLGGVPSRVSSTRARDYERPSVRDNGSPVLSDSIPKGDDDENDMPKFENHIRETQKKRERTTITTTERIVRRSPVKESANAGNRAEPDRQRK